VETLGGIGSGIGLPPYVAGMDVAT